MIFSGCLNVVMLYSIKKSLVLVRRQIKRSSICYVLPRLSHLIRASASITTKVLIDIPAPMPSRYLEITNTAERTEKSKRSVPENKAPSQRVFRNRQKGVRSPSPGCQILLSEKAGGGPPFGSAC